jgi:uncharacterized membrane protein YqjE
MVGARTLDAAQVRANLLILVGTAFTLGTLLAGVALVFWQSYREWGSLPSPYGPAAIVYGGVVVGIALAVAMVVWAYRQWRNSART